MVLFIADTKPGCVLRQANYINLLQRERNLITDEDVEACKNSYNTWAFVGKDKNFWLFISFKLVIYFAYNY